MPRTEITCLLVASLTVAACGDDGSSTTTSADTTSTSTTDTTSTTDPTVTSSPTITTDVTTDPTMGSESSSSGSETDATGPGDGVVLQNDSWTEQDGLVWQTWPSANDCWAAVYDIDNQYYPFDILRIEAALGDTNGTEDFEVGIWDVDNQNQPTQVIDSAVVSLTGGDWAVVDLAAEGIVVPTIQNGTFAAVMCHVSHMGSPSIAIDADGNVAASNNWVFQVIMDEWVQAPDFFGIDGDFILRAVIDPQM